MAGLVPIEVSVLLLSLLAIVTFAAGSFRFRRMDG
jgi:hypothetical protein